MTPTPLPSYHFGLTGYPLGHSLSPAIHQAALQALGLPGDYRLFPVPPQTSGVAMLHHLLEQVRQGELHGLNVTIPHKQTVLQLMDSLTPAAQAIGAINTIIDHNGRLLGDNTDAGGFIQDLCTQYPAAKHPGRGWVLGAGGSGRAIAYALKAAGWEIWVIARRLSQAQELLGALGEPAYNALPLTTPALDAELTSRQPDLVVNCTPLGMVPRQDASPWPAGLPWPEQACIYDLVYNPRPTRFVAEARRSGLPAFDGLGMLVEQAALAIERWVGRSVPRPPLRRAAELASHMHASQTEEEPDHLETTKR